MATSVFEDKVARPDDKMLAGALGKSNRLWQENESPRREHRGIGVD